MRSKKFIMIIAVVLVGLAMALFIVRMDKVSMVNDSHGKIDAQPVDGDPIKGPHGGRLLSKGGFQLEITIYERGVPPQFRVYPFDQGKPAKPDEVKLTIELHRLGGRVDVIRFQKEEEYLRGGKVVEEPHSFDVKVVAEHKGRSYQWEYSQSEGRVEMTPEAVTSSGIVSEAVGPVRMKSVLDLPGEIVLNADKVTHIVPRFTGIVTEVRKNLGDEVRKGEVIAVLHSRELTDLKSEYLSAMKRVELAQSIFDREENLWKKKISAEQDYLVSRQAFLEAEINLKAAAQKLLASGLSQTDLNDLAAMAEGVLSRYELKAPIDGVVIEKHVAVGEAVKEDADLFVLADLSTVWVDITVYAKDLNVVKVGQKVTVKSDVSGIEASGRLTYLGPMIGEQTRSARARVVIPNSDGRWRPGLFVAVQLVREEVTVPLAVNADALQTFRDWDVVFIQVGNLFEARPVELGRRDGEWVEVVSGLSAGERVVSKNSFILKADVGKSSATHDH